jgi:hypothetical protein
VWEFGAGSGALAAQLLTALGERVQRYAIVELSGTLRQRQAGLLERLGRPRALAGCAARAHRGVVRGQRGARCDAGAAAGTSTATQWFERGVA